MKFVILSMLRKYVEKIQVALKCYKNNGTLHEDQYTFFITSLSILLKIINISDKFVEKLETHILRSTTYFSKIVQFF